LTGNCQSKVYKIWIQFSIKKRLSVLNILIMLMKPTEEKNVKLKDMATTKTKNIETN
jgi:hypothetical protein